MTFSKKEIQIILLGLGMYATKFKKLMKDSESLKAGEKEIKRDYLEIQALINRLSNEE